MTEVKKERKILNPTPEELSAKLDLRSANSIPKSKDSTTIPLESLLESNINEISKPELSDMSMGKIKPQESVFAPKSLPFKLICGKHNYPNMENIGDDGLIYVRKMSSKEENLFYEDAQHMTIERFNSIITQVLSICVRSNINTNKLYSIEKLPLFIFILSLTYENIRQFKLICDFCSKEYLINKDIKSIKTKYLPEELIIPMPITLEGYGYPINLLLHYPTIDEEDSFTNEELDVTTRIRFLVDKIEGVLPTGEQIEEKHYDDIMAYLDKEDIKKIKVVFDEIRSYGFDFEETLICDNKKCSGYKLEQKQSLNVEDFFKIIYE